MKIAASLLRRYIDIPRDARALRDLLDDVGIEVKRVEVTDQGEIFALELLANRGDHHCYDGIATEIAGRTGATVTRPPIAALAVGDSPIELKLESDLCLVYTATELVRDLGTGDQALSHDDLRPLLANDIHSVSPAVDASNLGNLEFGQPTHAFDLNTLVGPITIRVARPGERCWPLFSELEPLLLWSLAFIFASRY